MNEVEVVITADMIIQLGKILGALGAIGGVIAWVVRFVQRQKKQDEELAAMRKEQTILCYGVLSCLKGLQEQGCNGPVKEARSKLEKHLNKAAHHIDELIET